MNEEDTQLSTNCNYNKYNIRSLLLINNLRALSHIEIPFQENRFTCEYHNMEVDEQQEITYKRIRQ